MRATTLPHALLALASLASAAVNVTETNTVDLIAGKGDLGWGASGLAFGYSAGSGLNFDTDLVGAGFNGAVPGQADGAIGAGFTVNSTTLELGVGLSFGGSDLGLSVIGNRETGELRVMVNGKEVALN